MREFLRGRIAHFKVPSGVTFVAELPKTATGKIQKYVLRGGAGNLSRQLPMWQGNRLMSAGSLTYCVHLRFLASGHMSDSQSEEVPAKPRFSRRVFIIGAAGAGAAAGLSRGGIAPAAQAATAPSGPPTTTLPLPTTTNPEQLLLTWGNDPATEVTVSWAAPGTVRQPAPTLAYSTEPITKHNPGKLIHLPEPQPLDVSKHYADAAAVSFTDGLNGQTIYHYHVQLQGLRPGTRYYYQVSDGAATPSVAGSSFETAPFGRAPFRFSSYGDLSTPSWDLNASGNIWHESCDNSWYAVTAIENPGDGKGAPLFHLLNGDLCYANLDIENAPGVWRDFGINVARSSANRPWLPALGNHETEFGTYSHSGKPGNAPGGIAAQGAAGNYWNGPYGYGHYLSQVPAAGQRRGQLGRQPAAGQLLRLPGRHGQVHLAGRRRRHLPGRRLRLPELRPQRRPGDHLLRRVDPERHRHLQPRSTPATSRRTRRTTPWCPTSPAASLTSRRCGSSRRWRRPATTRRST